MHSISDVDDIDQRMLTEQMEEARKLRPLIWLLVFLAPIGLILGLLWGIAIGGW